MSGLIPEAGKAYRLASVQVLTLASIVWGAWIALPPDQQAAIAALLGIDPSRWMPLLGFLTAIVARLVAQPAVTEPKDQL